MVTLRSGRVLTTTTTRRTSRKRSSKKKVPKPVRQAITRAVNRSLESGRDFRTISSTATSPSLWINEVVGSSIQQGDKKANRHGNKIFMKGIQVRFLAKSPNTTQNAWIRILLVKRKQPGLGDTALFQSSSQDVDGYDYDTPTLGLDKYQQIIAPINKERYEVMFDRKYRIIGQDMPGSAGRQFLVKKFWIPIKKHLTYTTTLENATNILPNYKFYSFIQWDDYSTIRTCELQTNLWYHFNP